MGWLEYVCRCLIEYVPFQHQFVIIRAFYPLFLTVSYPVRSAYIITFFLGVEHSWRDYCSLNAHPLRSTVAVGLTAYLGISLY